jgi:hypothetical protein
MKTGVNLAIETLCQCAYNSMRRIPSDCFDYGDDETVHANLKRVDFDINNDGWSRDNDCFGVFCGKLRGKYVVGVMGLREKYNFHSCEMFNTLDEMKREWQLD